MSERFVRMYANHLAFMVRGPYGGPYTLVERYGDKRKLGPYRSVDALERAIERYARAELRRLESSGAKFTRPAA